MFSETKPFFKSRGVVGGGIAALAGLAQLLGYATEPNDVKTLTDLLMGLVVSGGGILSIIGRIFARTQIG